MDLTTVQAVLFDMDGTLVDSDAAVERGWLRWAQEYGIAADTARRNVVHGSPSDHTIARLRPDLTGAALARAVQRQLAIQYEDLDGVLPTTGALELLAVLDSLGLPWAVVTSADRRLARARLGVAGISAPELVTVDDIRAGKPDPESYLLGAHRLGIAASRCLVVEDAEPGVAAGRAAGSPVAALKGIDGDLRIADLTELTRALLDAHRPAGVPGR